MDIEVWMTLKYRAALAWWLTLGPNGPYYLWLGGGVLALLVWSWVSYRAVRRILGQRKFNGTWYNAQRWLVLLQDTQDRERQGLILNYKEAKLLELYRTGRRSKLRDLARRGGSV